MARNIVFLGAVPDRPRPPITNRGLVKPFTFARYYSRQCGLTRDPTYTKPHSCNFRMPSQARLAAARGPMPSEPRAFHTFALIVQAPLRSRRPALP